MKILISGGAGFIGSHLTEFYLNKGCEVLVVDHFGSGNNIIEGAEYKKMNVYDDKVLDLGKFDMILHFASRASPPDYQKYPIDTILANTRGTSNLLTLAEKSKCKFLFASTSEIYGDPFVVPTPESYWGYVNPCGPRSCYDNSKRLGETFCYEFFRKGVDVRVIRIFNTYGPRMRKDDGRVITNFVNQALNNLDITIYGSGEQKRSYCYIDDLIKGIEKLMDAELERNDFLEDRVFNMGNPNEYYSVKELANIVLKLIPDSNSKLVHHKLPKDDPKDRRPSIEKAIETLKWEPKTDIETGLKKVITYFKNLD